MASNDVYLSVIVPAYNEAERITKTLERLDAYLGAAAFSYEIIVVTDGPTDNTVEIVREIATRMARLKILERQINCGKGFSVQGGMLHARGRVRLFTDADNSTDIAHFDAMKPLFDEGCDVVIASRNPGDASGACQAVAQVWHKRWVGHLGNLIVQLLAVPGIWDTQCGFKAFRDAAAERIFSQTTISGWGFDIETLALARRLKYRVGIIPAHWINDDRTHVRPLDYFRVLGDTLRVRANLLTRKYRF